MSNKQLKNLTDSLRRRSSLASMSSLNNVIQYRSASTVKATELTLLKSSADSIWWKIQECMNVQKFKPSVKAKSSNDDSQASAKLLFPFLVLNPRRRLRLIWDLGMLCFALLSIFTVLLRLAFEPTQLRYRNYIGAWGFYNNHYLMAMEYTLDILFLFNFILQFRTAYFVRLPSGSHSLVTEPRLILLRYLRSWFISDLVASIPWELIVNAGKMAQGLNPFEVEPLLILSLARIPRIFLLVRVKTIFTLTNFEDMDRDILTIRQMMTIHSGVVRVAKLLLVLVLNIHLWACVVFYIGTLYDIDFHGESWLINTKASTLFHELLLFCSFQAASVAF